MPEDLVESLLPMLRIKWDGNTLKITGDELAKTLDAGTPRIQFDEWSGSRPDEMESSVTIMPYMMMPGDDKIVADAIFAALSHPPAFFAPEIPQGSPANVAGIWDVQMKYLCGEGRQRFSFGAARRRRQWRAPGRNLQREFNREDSCTASDVSQHHAGWGERD